MTIWVNEYSNDGSQGYESFTSRREAVDAWDNWYAKFPDGVPGVLELERARKFTFPCTAKGVVEYINTWCSHPDNG